MRFKNFLIAGAGMVTGVALTLTTVSMSTRPAAAQADAHEMARKAQVMAVTFQLDMSDLHDIDEGTHAGTIPAGALGNVRRARIATMATDWPDALREQAAKLGGHMMELEEALRAEDAARAAPHAKEVHEMAHDLSAATYTMLSGAQPAPAHGH